MNETPTYHPTELDLMLSGDRPCAMFADLIPGTYDIPVDAFRKYVDEGLFVMRDETLEAKEIRFEITAAWRNGA